MGGAGRSGRRPRSKNLRKVQGGEPRRGPASAPRLRARHSIVLGLFPFLQQALEHDVPCNDAIRDYQSLVASEDAASRLTLMTLCPSSMRECFEDGDRVRITLGVENGITLL